MNTVSKIFVVVFVMLCCADSYAQMSKHEESAFLDNVIKHDLPNSSNAEIDYSILDQQVNLKDIVTKNLLDSIKQIDKDIYNNEIYYDRLNAQLDYEKNIYSDLIVKAHRLRSMMYENFDIFSFDNLYTTYRQFLYVKWLTDYRKKKILRINNLKRDIVRVVADLEHQKNEHEKKSEELGVQEDLKKQYKSRRSALLKNLTNDDVVNNEIRRDNLDSIKITRNSDNQSDSSTLFQLQEGYLMWPVHKAVIINYFGEKQHPVFADVKIKNDGLDFCVPSSSEVKCVYHGVVAKITLLPRNKYVVIVRHGSYFTVYNGLDHIKVATGDEVERGGVIGTFETDNQHANFNFQIWKGTQCLDPYKWLIKYSKK